MSGCYGELQALIEAKFLMHYRPTANSTGKPLCQAPESSTEPCSGKFHKADENINSAGDVLLNTSLLLDTLLSEEKYDRKLRPGFGGPAVEILTDIEIRSFGSISETDMVYSMDCYFRQTWWDKRLKFQSANLDVLSMDWKFLQRVWIPDTYFLNGQKSYLHNVTVPNKFIRVRRDGQLKYSMRLTIKARCPMHLRKYPLDSQACPLKIGSFAYTVRDVIYKWKGSDPVIISKGVTLSQYEFPKIITTDMTTKRKRSILIARFILNRRRGYFILQIYAPCAMIVGASWVSFWINRHETPGRVAVGATTVLTLVTMGFGGRTSLPKVPYPTALDWFMITCLTFVFSAMVEYACVQMMGRYDEERQQTRLHSKWEETKKDDSRKNRKKYSEPYVMDEMLPSRADKIDTYSRVLFPFTFTLLNILYWVLYLYTIGDEIADDLT
ncbi:gamma-aminobutyric acid receptor subunit alpha-6-like [Tachypleus tridentatus]|uniref:gamma-aminobutyric acid receptor subunit alpha-6-like n=1 Tax=Tachypleus tridentatus TaxID=6853 RepID=UPI003FD062B7